jgi:acetyl-CoA carboxylase biotin carboxylase subunit
MIDVALKAMKRIRYNNVGTIEFLLDEKGRYYFMEMNTRIQVEHPVTELVYGIDLVREQIVLASGEKLTHKQSQVKPNGHAIECRINAEDPVTFAPSPGRIVGYHQPGGPGVRVDTMAYEQYKVQPYYDSLLAKLLVWGETRDIAIKRMRRALREYIVEGIKTNIPFQRRVLTAEAFVSGHYDTRLVAQILDAARADERPGPTPGPTVP